MSKKKMMFILMILFACINALLSRVSVPIFTVIRDEVKLVYNQKNYITSIAKTDSRISMVIQSNIPEVDVEAVTHTIWSVDGILKFKDN